jgi:glycosyltransferase involved in cell wall biosynthesis
MKLSILIPSRNEPYLEQTVEDIKRYATTNPEILVGDDTEGIGQRAMLNQLARKATGDYLMKTDAHCTFGMGFDETMLKKMDERTVAAPYMMVLNPETWTVRPDKKSSAYYFDSNLIFQYHLEAENSEVVNETMALQGSCFMVNKDTYWKWNLCDESLGSWGQQGVELGIKTWLAGGRCVTIKTTYYGHLFRHTEGEFPYQRSQDAIDATYNRFIKQFKNKRLIPLIEKFNYPGDWDIEKTNALST